MPTELLEIDGILNVEGDESDLESVLRGKHSISVANPKMTKLAPDFDEISEENIIEEQRKLEKTREEKDNFLWVHPQWLVKGCILIFG